MARLRHSAAMRGVRLSLLLALLGLAVPAVGEIQVVATIFPLADLVREIGGGQVSVLTLLPAGANPHTWEPTPGEMRRVARADLVVSVGAGLDDWVGKLVDAQRRKIRRVAIAEGMPLLPGGCSHAGESGHEAHDHDHVHPGAGEGGDPHVWLDPRLLREHAVGALEKALAELAPERASEFAERADRLRQQLAALETELATLLSPVRGKGYVAVHSAWQYFARRFGLREVAVIEPFPGREPSAREVVSVLARARREGVRVLVAEPQFNVKVAQQMARDLGGEALLLDPFGGPGVAGHESYGAILRTCARRLREALE